MRENHARTACGGESLAELFLQDFWVHAPTLQQIVPRSQDRQDAVSRGIPEITRRW